VVFVWVVPVVAAAVGVVVLLSRVRTLEDLSVELMVAIRRTGELREPLTAIRDEMDRSAPLVDRVWSHWSNEATGPNNGHERSHPPV
jgi:hypothetical protein